MKPVINNAKNYLISLVIPVYNAKKDLAQCLESIVTQDDHNFEVILVDDGSTDHSSEIANTYKNKIKNFRVIKQANAGSGGARNNGILHSQGEFILFLDSDDYVTRNYISVLRKKQQRGNYNMVCGRYKLVNESGMDIRDPMKAPPQFHPPLTLHEEILGAYERCVPVAKLFRKDEYLKANIKFPRKIPHEDWFFTYKLVRKLKTIGFVEDQIYYWRHREGSTSRSMSTTHIDILPFLRNDTFLYLKQNSGTKREFALAARRNLIITNNFRNRIRQSGETNLEYYASLVNANQYEILSDLNTYESSEFHDLTLAKAVRNIIEECEKTAPHTSLSASYILDGWKKNTSNIATGEASRHMISKRSVENSKLKLSLITPSYNQASYVREMIKSIKQQNVLPFEHIILDAGSNDGTLGILSNYEKESSFVKVHIGRDNGQSNAINLGFLEASGDIISWLNTDDRYYSCKVVEKVLETFENHPEVDVIYGRGNFIDAEGNFHREAYLNKEPDKLKYKFINSVGVFQPALFMRRNVFEKTGPLSEKYGLCFDYEYWIRIANGGCKFFFLDEILCEAVLHQDSKTIGQRSKQLTETACAVKEHYGFVSTEWIHKLVDAELTGADGITTTTANISEKHAKKAKQYFTEFNHNQESISAILSMGHYSEVEKTLKILGPILKKYSTFQATAFNSRMFHKGLTLIKHLQQHTKSKNAILVYDHGLNNVEINILKHIKDVYILKLPLDDATYFANYFTAKAKGFRLFITWHAGKILPKGSLFIYIDPEIVPIQDISHVNRIISKDDVLILDSSDRKNTEKPLTISHISNECIRVTDASNKELISPLVLSRLVGYKIGSKYQELFETAHNYSLKHEAPLIDKVTESITTINPISQEQQKIVMNNIKELSKLDHSELKKIFGYRGHRPDQSILSILVNRFNAPIAESMEIYTNYRYPNNWNKAIDDNIYQDYAPEFELEADILNSSAVFINHKGLYVNSQGLKFNLDRKSRALIMGNGPSVKVLDFSRLEGFDVFGMNAAYRYWDRINWYPQYYSCLDVVVGISHAKEIKRMIENAHEYGIKKFLLLDNLIKELEISQNQDRIISFDKLKEGSELLSAPSITTGSHTTAWAAYLGYEEIYLIGIDSNYVEVIEGAKHVEGAVLEMETTPGNNPNYFFNDYQQKGDVYHIPNPKRPLHLLGWREIAGRMRFIESKILNANPLSKVDAFDFCHFSEIEQGKPTEIIPRERVVVNNFIINSLKEQNNHQGNRTVLFSGKTEGFNLKSFINEDWHVFGLVSDEILIKNVGSRYELDIIGLDISEWKRNFTSMIDLGQNINAYSLVVTEDYESSKNLRLSGKKSTNALKDINYLFIGSESGIKLSESTIRTHKPEVIEIYCDEEEGVVKNEDITTITALLKSLGYTTYLLLRTNKHKEHDGFLFYHSCKELPSSIKQCSIYACATPLDLGQLLDQVTNLDTHHLYLVQKYGFSFENVFKTEGVKDVDGRFKLSAPSGKNYIAFRYSGKVRPHDLITGSITFFVNSPAKVKLMLCRDGSTPFEHGNKKITIEPGKHTLDIDHKFEFYHSGVRIQLGVEDGNPEMSEITTMISVRREEKVMEVEGVYSHSGLTPQLQKVLTEQPASVTKRLVERIQRSLYLYYRKAVELFFPESTKHRHYAGLLKGNIVLFIIRIKNIFR